MDDLHVTKSVVIPGWELWITTSTSGGPGGQHANKTESRVTLHWEVETSTALTDSQKKRVAKRLASYINSDGVLQISCGDTRSQHQNRDKAREQMVALVQKGISRPKRRKKTRVPRSQKRKRLRNKRHRSKVKEMRKNPTKKDW